MHGVVDREAVVVAQAVRAEELVLEVCHVVVVDVSGERVGEVEPGHLVVAGVQEDVDPLVAADLAVGRMERQLGLDLVEQRLDGLLGLTEVVDVVVPAPASRTRS